MAKRQVSLLSYFGNANGPTQQQIKSYDRDDNRKFKSKWFIQFTWLKVEEAKDKCEKLLKCRVCVNGKKNNIFTTGKSGSKPKKGWFCETWNDKRSQVNNFHVFKSLHNFLYAVCHVYIYSHILWVYYRYMYSYSKLCLQMNLEIHCPFFVNNFEFLLYDFLCFGPEYC